MSTKIYNAYRLRRGRNLWKVLEGIQDVAMHRCRARLAKLYDRMLQSPSEFDGFRLGALPYMDASRWVHSAYGAQVMKSLRDLFDLDVSVAVHNVDERYLFRAFPGSGLFHDSLDFLETHPALEDYHYQNQADQPSSVSNRAWNERRVTWERAMRPDGYFKMQLCLDIVSINGWSQVDPSVDMERRRQKRARKK
jgi:hypothetical protein